MGGFHLTWRSFFTLGQRSTISSGMDKRFKIPFGKWKKGGSSGRSVLRKEDPADEELELIPLDCSCSVPAMILVLTLVSDPSLKKTSLSEAKTEQWELVE